MLPTLHDRRRQEQHDHDWRFVQQPPAYYEDSAPRPRPLPPLRSTLYREDDAPPPPPHRAAWQPPITDARRHDSGSRAMAGPPPQHQYAQSHLQPRMDLFAHLPLASSSSTRVQRLDEDRAMDDDEFDDDDDHYQHRSHPYSQQQQHHQGSSAAAAAAAKKRSRRMSNSERGKLYRSRRKEYVETLEDQVEALKQQLEEMRVRGGGSGANAGAGAVTPASPYNVAEWCRDRSRAGLARIVCEYFSLFQFGVPLSASGHRLNNRSPSLAPTQALAPPAPDAIVHSSRLMSFMETLVDPNMRFGDNFGVQMLLEQWERYSAYHSSLKYELNSIEVLANEPSPLIVATATLKVRFSLTTIEKVFPHVLHNEALVQQLVGLEVEYPVGNKFYFGPDGKIKRYETEVDFVSAFVKALGNVHDAMQVVGNALIKEQHRIGEDADVAGRGGATAASPTESHGSSSRDSSHTHSPIPTHPPSARQRHKQSEARRTEEVFDEYSTPGVRQYPPHNTQRRYYDEDARPYARAAGELHYQEASLRRPLDRTHDFPTGRPHCDNNYQRSDAHPRDMAPRNSQYE